MAQELWAWLPYVLLGGVGIALLWLLMSESRAARALSGPAGFVLMAVLFGAMIWLTHEFFGTEGPVDPRRVLDAVLLGGIVWLAMKLDNLARANRSLEEQLRRLEQLVSKKAK